MCCDRSTSIRDGEGLPQAARRCACSDSHTEREGGGSPSTPQQRIQSIKDIKGLIGAGTGTNSTNKTIPVGLLVVPDTQPIQLEVCCPRGFGAISG